MIETLAKPTIIQLDDALAEEVATITHGLAAACFQCGACTATCPWGLVGGGGLSVRTLVRRAQLGLEANGALWRCTTCAACEANCPRGVPITDVMVALREVAWRRHHVPQGMNSLMWGLYWDGNPWGRPPSRRSDWARGLNLPAFDATSEVLYYVGCTASYDRRLQRVARALAGIFQAAGVRFGTLGDQEPCCGESAHNLGQAGLEREIVTRNEKLFTETGVGTMVTLSPHCFDMFKHHHFLDERPTTWRPLHYTEFLAELLAAGRLHFTRPLALRVTYHDPCYLGRRNGLYDAPRAVLAAIPGVELVEMEPSREAALCCGGGGGRMWQETPAGERFADLRVGQALDSGADVLSTTCPHCIACLDDSAKQVSTAKLPVVDIAELVAGALGLAPVPASAREVVAR